MCWKEFEINDASSTNSEISQKDLEKDDFTVCWANLTRGYESFV